ncbi:hypothetical protein ACFONI_20905 [Aeromonas media]|uniref:hypothetical protein n=1 Tax=Aeromonas media TaxID=651 RepID=UPI0005B1E718
MIRQRALGGANKEDGAGKYGELYTLSPEQGMDLAFICAPGANQASVHEAAHPLPGAQEGFVYSRCTL